MSLAQDYARLRVLLETRPAEVGSAASEDALTDWLYRNWYINPVVDDAASHHPPFDQLGSALNAIIHRVAPWRGDWVMLSAGADGSIMAGQGQLVRWQHAGEYASVARPGLPPAPGELAWVSQLLSWVDMATGQWAAQSLEPPAQPQLRVYFNVAADQVGSLVATLAQWLAAYAVKFSMKCPGQAAGFARADALVLYVELASWNQLEKLVPELVASSAVMLRNAHPAFTDQVIEGVACAEDPGDGQSFGRNRCALIAPVVAQCMNNLGQLVPSIQLALLNAGLDPACPWKSPAA